MEGKKIVLKNDHELYAFLKINSINGIGKNVINNFIKNFDWYCYNQYNNNKVVLNDFYIYYRNY